MATHNSGGACPHCLHAQEPGTTCGACGLLWRRGAGDGGGSAAYVAAGSASREELLALLAAALAERDAARSERDAARAAAPFRGPAADSVLGERLIDVIGIVAALGFAAEVAHCLYLCGETYRKGDKGATNDMLARSMEKQGWAALLRAARAAKRDYDSFPSGSTQLIRAARANDLPRVLQLVQLGAPLELKDTGIGKTALHSACRLGHEHIARALLDGKYEGRAAKADARDKFGWTPLMSASLSLTGREGVVRLLLARGARLELQGGGEGWTALHAAARSNRASIITLLCAAPGAAAALALRDAEGNTPLGLAIAYGSAACEAALRAHGAPI
jgi:hypothetical protein